MSPPRKVRSGRRQFPGSPAPDSGMDQLEQILRDPGVQRLRQQLRPTPGPGPGPSAPQTDQLQQILRDPGIQQLRQQLRPTPGPGPSGTEQDWERVMQDPDVQRALRDPGIQQALYHNLQSSVPGGMASVVPPPGSSARPLRFQQGGGYGGMSIAQQIAVLEELKKSATPQKQQELEASIQALRQVQMRPQTEISPATLPGGATASGSSMSGINQMVNPVSPGNTAAAIGMGALAGLGATSHQGLAALVGAGTAGLLNYFVRKYGKGAQQRQQQGLGRSNVTSQAGYTSQGLSTNQEANLNTPAGTGPQPVSPANTTPATPVNVAPQTPQAPKAPPSSGLPEVIGKTESGTNIYAPETPRPALAPADSSQASTTSAGATTDTTTSPSGSYGGPGQGVWMGSANSSSGNVVSYDAGKTWVDPTDPNKKPYTGSDVGNVRQISPSSSLIGATPTTTPPVTTADLWNLPTRDSSPPTTADLWNLPTSAPSYSPLSSDWFGYNQGGPAKFAEGGDLPLPPKSPKAVLRRKPMGMAIPVLHTTIVIAAKPKAKKKPAKSETKQMGGVIRPAKPHLLPPLSGPQDHGDRPRAHGRVQVPRGSGAAIRGKRFGGIY